MENKKSLVPSLRFPEFREAGEWETKKIKEVCDILQGYGFPEIMQGRSQGKYPFCKVSDVSKAVNGNSGFIKEAVNYINDNEISKLNAKPIPKGTTIFAKIGEALRLNRRAITIVECLIDNNVVGLKSKTDSACDYFIFILAHRIDLNEYCGGAIPSVNKTTLGDIEVSLPTLPEQQKIAACLSSLDELITAHSQKLDALKKHKKGLMQQLFPAEGQTVPSLRFPEFREAGEWVEKNLSQLTTKISDGIHATPIYDENGEYVFINGNNLSSGKILIDNKTKRVDFFEYTKHKKPLDSSSILISINGTIGNLAFFRDEPVILGKSACFINVNLKLADKFFIYSIIQTNMVKNIFAAEATGSTIKNLSLNAIKNLQLLVPTLSEQQKIAACLSSLDELITAQSQKLGALKKHKKGLMQQLFPT